MAEKVNNSNTLLSRRRLLCMVTSYSKHLTVVPFIPAKWNGKHKNPCFTYRLSQIPAEMTGMIVIYTFLTLAEKDDRYASCPTYRRLV